MLKCSRRQRKVCSLIACAAGATMSTLSSSPLQAASYTWTNVVGGAYTWTDPANWISAAPGTPAYPNLANDSANLSGPIMSGDLNIILPSNISVATLTLGATGSPFNTDIGNLNSGGGKLTFDSIGSINSIGVAGSANSITAPIQLNGNMVVAPTSTVSLALSGGLQMNGNSRTITNSLPAGSATLTMSGSVLLYDATTASTSRNLTLDGGGNYEISSNFFVGDGITTGNTGTVILGNNSLTTQTLIHITSNNSMLVRGEDLRRAVLVLSNDSAVGSGSLQSNTAAGNFMAELQSDDDTRALKARATVLRPMLVGGTHSLTLDNGVQGAGSAALVNLLPAGKTLTINNNVFLWNTNTDQANPVAFDGSGSTVINGKILNNNLADTSASAFIKRGTGTVTLNNTTSTYRGNTNVQGGLLIFGAANTWGNTGDVGAGINVTSGGAIWYGPGPADATGFTAMLDEVQTTSSGALAIPATLSASNFNFTAGSLVNAAGMTIGAQGNVTYTGTVTPGFAGYGWGGVGTLTLNNNNRMTGANNVRYGNGGTVIVNGTQSYSGVTTIEGGNLTTDQVRAAARVSTGGVSTLAFSTVLQISSIANGGVNSSLGSSPNDAADLVLNGGTLRFVGAASGDTDRLFTVGSFGGIIDASGSVPLHFTNTLAHASTGTGNRVLTLTGSNAGDNAIAGILSNASVSALLSLSKTGTGTWMLSGNNTFTGGTSVSAGSLVVGHPNAIGNATLTVTGGTTQLQPNLATAVKVTALNITTPGVVDVTNNDIVIDYTGAGPNPSLATTVRQHLSSGRIMSSSGTTTTRVGYGDNAVLGKTTFGGLSVDTGSMLIKYTYAGDADLDGDADGVDIGTWATNFTGELGGLGSNVWTQGDWDYDGDVDGVDAGLWAQAFTGELGGGGLGQIEIDSPIAPGAAAILKNMGITVVPEPASFGLIAAIGCVAMRRRRRS